MDDSTRRLDNVYWTWRRYLKASLPSEKVFYNPSDLPKPTNVNRWIIFQTGLYRPERFAESVPRLMCVARFDEEDQALVDLVSDVLAVVDKTNTDSKFIDFYDKTSATVIGTIDVIRTPVGPTMDYDTGIDSISIDVFTRIKTARTVV